MTVNVSNMPMNTLYKFADDSYVWSVMLNESRGGNYPSNEPRKYTEVYRIDGTGVMIRVASGRLIENPSNNDFNKRFAIYDPDEDCDYSFFVETPFKKADLNDLYKLRDSISRSYSNRNK